MDRQTRGGWSECVVRGVWASVFRGQQKLAGVFKIQDGGPSVRKQSWQWQEMEGWKLARLVCALAGLALCAGVPGRPSAPAPCRRSPLSSRNVLFLGAYRLHSSGFSSEGLEARWKLSALPLPGWPSHRPYCAHFSGNDAVPANLTTQRRRAGTVRLDVCTVLTIAVQPATVSTSAPIFVSSTPTTRPSPHQLTLRPRVSALITTRP